ncbi:hypothetical protein F4780DRAFT_366875 [Xylariomycetidae sp. FL0641]|nr:hypothetical protein F4780DRAFT_366875 [Xylariomycetidae sp. FL0641]
MCKYRKSLYACNHAQVCSEPFIACQAQKDHLSGESSEPCDIVETHGRSTIKISKMCAYCEEKKVTLDQQFDHVKGRMADLRKQLEKSYENCMKHLDDVGLEPEKKPDSVGSTEQSSEEEELDPVQAFLKKKMADPDSHLMMLGSS